MTTPIAARLRRGLPLVAAALLVTACSSLADDSSPTLIAEDALPAELVELETTSTTDPPGATELATLYLVYSDQTSDAELIECKVLVTRTGTVADAATVRLERLIDVDPTESSACGNFLTNAIPPELELLDVAVANRVAVVDLANLSDVESTAQRQAVAQIVFTLTDPGWGQIDGVQFLLDGEPTPVAVDERTAEAGATITRADFGTLDDTPRPTTTVTPPAVPAVPSAPSAPDPTG